MCDLMKKRLLDYVDRQDDGLYIGMPVKLAFDSGNLDAVVTGFDEKGVTVNAYSHGFALRLPRKAYKWYDGCVI